MAKKNIGLTARNKTLGEMMSELRARLGFVSQGPAAKGNDAVMKSFCQEAHEFVYGELDPSDMRFKSVIRMQPVKSITTGTTIVRICRLIPDRYFLCMWSMAIPFAKN